MAGLLSLVTVIPILMPLASRVQEYEYLLESQRLALGLQQQGFDVVGSLPGEGVESNIQFSTVEADATPPEPLPSDTPCMNRPSLVSTTQGARLTWCVEDVHTGSRSWALSSQDLSLSSGYGGRLILALALIVGLSTALGMLQILSPLRTVPEGLRRLARGERDVYLSPTGIEEVDDLIDHLHAAARAMEDREDAIRGRAEVVTEIARIVAHEIRNPLQTMELVTEVMSQEEDASERLQLASSLREEISALEDVVSRLSTQRHEGLLRPRKDKVDVDRLVNHIVALRQPEGRARGIRIEAQVQDNVHFLADRALLVRALENLVTNAMSFVSDHTGHVRISGERRDDAILISVDDNGPGVASSILDKVFESGISKREGGSGLGLAFVTAIAEAHHGTVSHETSTLGGARFTLLLPKA